MLKKNDVAALVGNIWNYRMKQSQKLWQLQLKNGALKNRLIQCFNYFIFFIKESKYFQFYTSYVYKFFTHNRPMCWEKRRKFFICHVRN